MLFRNLDVDGDWKFGKGKASYARRKDALVLNIRTRLLSWANDCFFDMTANIDWLNRLGRKGQRELLEDEIKRTIAQTEGVVEVVSFSTSLIGRKFYAVYKINTIYGSLVTDQITVGV